MSDTSSEFKQGHLVWAKYSDYCFWPGRIASEQISSALKSHKRTEGVDNDQHYCVLFFGRELTYGMVEPSNIYDFKVYYNQYKNGDTGIDFEEALKLASSSEPFVDPPLELVEVSNGQKKQVTKRDEPKTEMIREADDEIANAEPKNTEEKKEEEPKNTEENKEEEPKNIEVKKEEGKLTTDANGELAIKPPTKVEESKTEEEQKHVEESPAKNEEEAVEEPKKEEDTIENTAETKEEVKEEIKENKTEENKETESKAAEIKATEISPVENKTEEVTPKDEEVKKAKLE